MRIYDEVFDGVEALKVLDTPFFGVHRSRPPVDHGPPVITHRGQAVVHATAYRLLLVDQQGEHADSCEHKS